MSVLIVIPARYASSRFPGKPLVELKGFSGISKTLIRRSWDAAMAVEGVDRVVVATDDRRISRAAQTFGAEVVMTSSNARNGTERCAEVAEKLSDQYEVICNLQGDAPLTPPWFMERLIDGLRAAPDAAMATPVMKCSPEASERFREDRRNGRVGATTAIFTADKRAIYFSKEVLPFSGAPGTVVYHHIGIYAYRPTELRAYTALPQGWLEKIEGLEQLRFIENGRPVQCVEVASEGREFWELNNPEDTMRIESILEKSGIE
ncbi:MAG: 3-deoxy-manno-octulosonate cytidylyltransferase [Rhodobacteraceae bacterium]|nr:3-deoxy-manno-octulosonate cytidylyltransferase [Paracoccaceae bacterium]